MHNLKVENYVLFGALLRPKVWDTASHIALRDCSKEVWEEPGYIGIFVKNKTKQVVEHQKIPAN